MNRAVIMTGGPLSTLQIMNGLRPISMIVQCSTNLQHNKMTQWYFSHIQWTKVLDKRRNALQGRKDL